MKQHISALVHRLDANVTTDGSSSVPISVYVISEIRSKVAVVMCKAMLMFEEICHEEDVVCSQPVVLFEGMKFHSAEETKRVMIIRSRWSFSIKVGSLRNTTIIK